MRRPGRHQAGAVCRVACARAARRRPASAAALPALVCGELGASPHGGSAAAGLLLFDASPPVREATAAWPGRSESRAGAVHLRQRSIHVRDERRGLAVSRRSEGIVQDLVAATWGRGHLKLFPRRRSLARSLARSVRWVDWALTGSDRRDTDAYCVVVAHWQLAGRSCRLRDQAAMDGRCVV